jgi:hypothetical protein
MKQYLVATGIVLIPVEVADNQDEWDAIEELKRRIDARRHEHYNPLIGISLVEAFDGRTAKGEKREKLNYMVLSADRHEVLCGEFCGERRKPVTRELAANFAELLTEAQWKALPASGHPEDILYPPGMSRATYELYFPKRRFAAPKQQ